MKYFKRLKEYKASNVTFDPEMRRAYSYGWWEFVREINGTVVFNNYSYSPSTCRHQWKVRSLMSELGIEIGLFVNTRAGLQACNGVHSGEELAFDALREAIQGEDLERAALIAKTFKVPLTQDFIQQCFNEKEESLCDEYLRRAFAYAEKRDAADVAAFKRLDAMPGEEVLAKVIEIRDLKAKGLGINQIKSEIGGNNE
jgi:hypothetical protein